MFFCEDKSDSSISEKKCSTGSVKCIGPTGPTGPTGADGAPGLSPYEIALKHGFVGTEEEWIESLKGPEGDGVMNGGIIPFSGHMYSSRYDHNADAVYLGFTSLGYSNQTASFNVVDETDNALIAAKDNMLIAFDAPYDATITAITVSLFGKFMANISSFDAYVSLFEAPIGESVFKLVTPAKILIGNVTPTSSDYEETYYKEKLNINYDVEKGTKIAILFYLLPVGATTVGDYAALMGDIYGGISFKEKI